MARREKAAAKAAPREKFVPAKPQSPNQKSYLQAIANHDIVFCQGHAGTGKTFLALSAALEYFYRQNEEYQRIIIIRPYIKSSSGEDIGALPGSIDEKVGPFLDSIRDNLRQLCTYQETQRLIQSGDIEFTVLSMCRGRSFSNCIVIVEEAQNVPLDGGSMKMLLTRLGKNAKLIIAGDTDQSDIPHERSGFEDAIYRLQGIDEIAFVEMRDEVDIRRSPVVGKILKRYADGPKNNTRM